MSITGIEVESQKVPGRHKLSYTLIKNRKDLRSSYLTSIKNRNYTQKKSHGIHFFPQEIYDIAKRKNKTKKTMKSNKIAQEITKYLSEHK